MDECTLRAVLRRVVLARVYSKGSVDDGDTHECTPRAVLGGGVLGRVYSEGSTEDGGTRMSVLSGHY